MADFLSHLGKLVKLIKFEAENECFCTGMGRFVGFHKVADFRGPAETLDFTDLVMMSFPKAKRFSDHHSAGPGPNAYDIVSSSSEKSVGW